MQAKKLITYHFFCLLSFETHGIASVARLQREEVSMMKGRTRRSSSNSTGFYEALHPLAMLQTFWSLQITRSLCSQNLLEVLHLSKSMAKHGKYTTNLITFYRQWRSFWLLPIPRYCKGKLKWSHQWHFCWSCPVAGVVAILSTIIFAIIDALLLLNFSFFRRWFTFVAWSSIFLLNSFCRHHTWDCRLLHQMAVDALQQQIHQQYCFFYLLSHQSLSGDPTFEGAARRLEWRHNGMAKNHFLLCRWN